MPVNKPKKFTMNINLAKVNLSINENRLIQHSLNVVVCFVLLDEDEGEDKDNDNKNKNKQ
jgi:hypothetical protein